MTSQARPGDLYESENGGDLRLLRTRKVISEVRSEIIVPVENRNQNRPSFNQRHRRFMDVSIPFERLYQTISRNRVISTPTLSF